MKIYTLVTNPVEANCHIVVNEQNNKCVLIDLGDGYSDIKQFTDQMGFTICAVLLTHGHFDHMMGCYDAQNDGVKIYVTEADSKMLSTDLNLGRYFGCKVNKITADFTLNDNDELDIEGIKIKVITTPGHTKGGCCYVIENNIFCGDTIFKGSYGRTDFRGGSMEEMHHSIVEKIFKLQGDYTLYCGHHQNTTLEFERKYNEILSVEI